jgi:hypothetical protein
MREIKFKGLIEKPDGERYWSYYGIGSKPTLFGGYKWIVEDLQFTGLPDKNGKEIWEGDIVKYGVDAYQVFYEGGAYCLKKDIWFSDNAAKHFEVIGNIYSNPELLK